MRALTPALALLCILALPAAAQVAGWMLEPGQPGSTASAVLAIGTPGTDRDAFRLTCGEGKLILSTFAAAPPRGVSEGDFPTRITVFIGQRELLFDGSGRVTGPGGASRIDAFIPQPASFLTSLAGVQRLTTTIYAGRRMALAPTPAQISEFRTACGFAPG